MIEPDCQACGACCVAQYDDDRYVELDRADARRLPAHARPWLRGEKLPVIDAERLSLATKKNAQGHCVCRALKGRVGEKVRCVIYEDRPEACRMFVPGSDPCLAARRELGLGALR